MRQRILLPAGPVSPSVRPPYASAWTRRTLVCVLLAAGLGCACGASEESPAAAPRARGRPVSFVFRTTAQETFDSRSTRGRATALLFVTTYDLASQVEARRLNDLFHSHRPRVNAGLVVLESEQYAVLADAFGSSLGLSFPVCLADEATRRGEGPFGLLDRVPTLIVLDRDGVEAWRKEGLASRAEMSKALTLASRRGSPVAE